MLDIQNYMSFIAAILVFQIIPGPGTLTILHATARNGIGAGLGAVAGTLLGGFTYMVGAVLGLAAVMHAYPLAFEVLQWFGAAYLCWLGIQLLRSSVFGDIGAPARREKNGWLCFRQAFLVSLTNPKVVLFFMAFFPLFLRTDTPSITLGAMMAHVTGISFLYQAGLVLVGNAVARKLTRCRKFLQSRVSAPDPCEIERTQPGREDSGSTRRHPPRPLSFHSERYQETPRALVAGFSNVGWDILVFIGQSLYQGHRTTDWVRRELHDRNVWLSPSEIEYLGRKFITCLTFAHRQATPRIDQAMRRRGGYILHLEVTHEDDAPALMSGVDGLSRVVLANVKIPSKHSDHIARFLRQLKQDYGDPIACVHDMGIGICKAVHLVFPGARDFVCHFHFLRDVGKDLLDPAYGRMRKVLQGHAAAVTLSSLVREASQHIATLCVDGRQLASAIEDVGFFEEMGQMPLLLTYQLALWCLQGKKCGDGLGFPFDRPLLEFAARVSTLNSCLSGFQSWPPDKDRIGRRLFSELSLKVRDIAEDRAFCRTLEELRWRSRLFDDLREKMRIAAGRSSGLDDDGTDNVMISMRKGVQQFRSRLDIERNLADDELCRKVAAQIDKFSDKLFADPLVVNTPATKLTIYPQRTDNILEQFIRGLRRNRRRKTGCNSMGRVPPTMLVDIPLVKNLDNSEYMQTLLGGKENLEGLLAEFENTRCPEVER